MVAVTRLFEGKDYFTIYDFVKAYEHFNDPEWDGEPQEPVVIKKPGGTDTTKGFIKDTNKGSVETPEERRPQKIKIKLADGKERFFQHQMSTTFWSPDGKPMSATEFVQRLFGEIPELLMKTN